jgi:hypothetical protein
LCTLCLALLLEKPLGLRFPHVDPQSRPVVAGGDVEAPPELSVVGVGDDVFVGAAEVAARRKWALVASPAT